MDFLRGGGQARSAQYTALDGNDTQLMSRDEQVRASGERATAPSPVDAGFHHFTARLPVPLPLSRPRVVASTRRAPSADVTHHAPGAVLPPPVSRIG